MKLWNNSLIKVGNSPNYYKTWLSKGIREVRHLMKDENSFLSLADFRERFDIKTNVVTFHGIISVLKVQRELLRKKDKVPGSRVNGSFAEKLLKAKKPNIIVYDKFIALKQIFPRRSQNKWITEGNLECSDSINCKAVYKLPFCCTKASKLIIFQFKFLHRRLATNDYLKKIGLREDDNCTFCKSEKESLEHLFWHCRESCLFWEGFQKLLSKHQVTVKANNYPLALVLGLITDVFSQTQQYFYFLVARYFIWTCKLKEILPKLSNFPNFLKCFCDLESDKKRKPKPLY